MRVFYDGVIYRMQKYGGVVRYFNGLIRHLPAHLSPVLLAPTQPTIPPTHSNLATHIETCEKWLWPIKPLRKEIIARRSYQRLLRENPDVVHPTYYYSSLRRFADRVKTPTVLTVYDLIHERFPEQTDPKGRQRRLKQKALERADAVICISESTKKDLLQFYSVPEERIEVIHLGCEFENVNQSMVADSARQSEPPYFLYVGSRGFYKNFDRLVNAFADFHSRHTDIRLKCVGGPAFTKSELQLLKSLNLENHVVSEGFVPDHEMPRLYANSVAFIYPSLYEGFGIPVLESMTCGGAVLTSNDSSLPEVAGDAAKFFDPYSVDSMAEAMETALDHDRREQLIRAGKQRAQSFSWRKAALATTRIYQALAPGRAVA